jgi:hypothetical protein
VKERASGPDGVGVVDAAVFMKEKNGPMKSVPQPRFKSVRLSRNARNSPEAMVMSQ